MKQLLTKTITTLNTFHTWEGNMKQLLTKTITTLLLALAIAPSLQAYPASLGVLQRGKTRVTLIGDIHGSKERVANDNLYKKRFSSLLTTLSCQKTKTRFLLEADSNTDRQEIERQQNAAYQQILKAQNLTFLNNPTTDTLQYVKTFALGTGLNSGSISFAAIDARTRAIDAIISVMPEVMPKEPATFRNSFDTSGVLQKIFGKDTFNDCLKDCEAIYQEVLAREKQHKLTEKAANKIRVMKLNYTEKMDTVRGMFSKSALNCKIVATIKAISKSPADKIAVGLPTFQAYCQHGFQPIILGVRDLIMTYRILDECEKHQNIVVYVGADHVVTTMEILQGAGFTVVKQVKRQELTPLSEAQFKEATELILENLTQEESKEAKADTAAKEEGKVAGATHVGAGSAGAAGAGSTTTVAKSTTCNNPGCATDKTKPVKLLDCGRCKQAHYCSAACQKAHWPTHKPSCKKA